MQPRYKRAAPLAANAVPLKRRFLFNSNLCAFLFISRQQRLHSRSNCLILLPTNKRNINNVENAKCI